MQKNVHVVFDGVTWFLMRAAKGFYAVYFGISHYDSVLERDV